ncbi:TadE family type IV pilus minor pilin [Streptomyces phytohabitans]|uniref:TadE family type IV pilus minor pilin n=1 Tax=Streptomyces phytohabitans TaxID=1150371 RepID=UPI00345B99C5
MRRSEEAREEEGVRTGGGHRTRDGGYVTAETAVVIPSLVFLVLALLWGVMTGATLVRCVDGAGVGARAAARGESRDAVLRAVRAVAPDGAAVEVVRDGDLVHVRVRARSVGPGPLTLPVQSRAVAMAESEEGS